MEPVCVIYQDNIGDDWTNNQSFDWGRLGSTAHRTVQSRQRRYIMAFELGKSLKTFGLALLGPYRYLGRNHYVDNRQVRYATWIHTWIKHTASKIILFCNVIINEKKCRSYKNYTRQMLVITHSTVTFTRARIWRAPHTQVAYAPPAPIENASYTRRSRAASTNSPLSPRRIRCDDDILAATAWNKTPREIGYLVFEFFVQVKNQY